MASRPKNGGRGLGGPGLGLGLEGPGLGLEPWYWPCDLSSRPNRVLLRLLHQSSHNFLNFFCDLHITLTGSYTYFSLLGLSIVSNID